MRIQKATRGVVSFQKGYFARHQKLFAELARNGQRPDTLFITCSDSRVLPNHFTGARPGELFIVRNVGNLIPRTDLVGGTASAIEYAVEVLGVDHIIVCGHTKCGAIEAILDPKRIEALPYVKRRLAQTERGRALIADRYSDLAPEVEQMAAVHAHVLMQLDNLRDY